MLKVGLLTLLFVGAASEAFAQRDTYVPGYTKPNGTYVQPHYRSPSDGNPSNNFSTYGNTNPYTGQSGTHHPQPNQGNNLGSGFGGNTYQPKQRW